ncbi:MAG: hypothetical protein JWQ79_3193 [Mucilaginibacter sp.]|nr:hypothetical protein [Mucilaginibacter sp.]
MRISYLASDAPVTGTPFCPKLVALGLADLMPGLFLRL